MDATFHWSLSASKAIEYIHALSCFVELASIVTPGTSISLWIVSGSKLLGIPGYSEPYWYHVIRLFHVMIEDNKHSGQHPWYQHFFLS